jgi:preprotein translocase subunit YajC
MGNTIFLAMAPSTQGGQGGGGGMFSLVFIGLMFLIFYFLLIRPQQQRQKKHQQLLANLKKGDRIVTTGGLFAQILNVKDDRVVATIADGVKVEIAKQCVSGVVEKA